MIVILWQGWQFRSRKKQAGFTLLELMVALAIFAMLAMTGWQIIDSLTKSRDRAKIQIKAISELQYAYLQLGQDLSQTTNYIAMPLGISQTTATPLPKIMPSFSLTAQGIHFRRFALPDPRYSVSPLVVQVEYSIIEDKLIKNQWQSVQPNATDTGSTSILLSGISQAKWTAFTPAAVAVFPDPTANINTNALQAGNPPNQNSPALDLARYQQLPLGIQLEFIYQDEPIVWRFALPTQAPIANGGNQAAGASQ